MEFGKVAHHVPCGIRIGRSRAWPVRWRVRSQGAHEGRPYDLFVLHLVLPDNPKRINAAAFGIELQLPARGVD